MAILVYRKDVDFDTIDSHLKKAPRPHVLAVQFIMIGAGFATQSLIPDGEYGKESEKTLDELYVVKEGY